MCLIPTGVTRQCEFSFGGLSAVYLANKEYMTPKKDADTGQVTGFTMTGGQKFYQFEAEPQTSQLLEELQAGNASKFIQQTLNFTISNITQAKKEVLEALALAKVAAIVKYTDGTFKLAGEDGEGLLGSTLTIDSGTAIADLNGATISLVGGSRGYANTVTSAAVTAVID